MNKQDFDKAVERLQRPFALRDIDWVPNFTYPKDAEKNYANTVIGVAAYVRREAVITRFNVVCGPGEWENIVEPLGNFGLYQGIAINREGEWIRKFDGAQMEAKDSGIDKVKAVISRSIRRVGEVWGVGLYLQYVPQLFAVKRPPDYYDAQFKWGTKGLTIRWDPPQLPKEYIPKYMTPEQYVRMKRIIPYFSEDKQKAAEELIAEWEDDPDSVKYEDAEMTIGLIEDRILARLNSIDNRAVTAVKQKKGNDTNSQPANSGQNKTDKSPDKVQQPPKENPPQQKSGQPEGSITAEEFKKLHSMFKQVEKLDADNIWVSAEKMQEIRQAANDHYQGKSSIKKEDFIKWEETLNTALTALKDDLPF